jgi:putative multiple sugar transport system permease protein
MKQTTVKGKTLTTVKNVMVKNTMIIILVLVFILFDILTNGRLLYAQNMSNLLLQNAYVIILACGMLLCILTGGNIDLSVGCVVCVCGSIAAQLMDKTNTNAILVIFATLGVALVIGCWHGFLIGYKRIPPFIVTLAGMFLFRGIARLILDSKTINCQNDLFLNIFSSYITFPGIDAGEVKWSAFIAGILVSIVYVILSFIGRVKKSRKGYSTPSLGSTMTKISVISACVVFYSWKMAHYKGIPIMALWCILVVFIYAYLTKNTVFGRNFYAVGGNEKAAKLSGIDTNKVFFSAYVNVALLAGLCGLIVLARVGSVNGDTGTQYELDSIGACFIGGASAYGGSGTIGGAIIGAIVMGIINQGMSIYGLNTNWQFVIKGAVILAAVFFDIRFNHKNTVK